MTNPPQFTPEYAAPAAPRSGMALTAMILGIASIPLTCVGVGILLGIAGLIVGIIALMQIRQAPQERGGRGMAITGIVTSGLALVVMPIALLVAILLPSLGRARELSNRAYCAANIRAVLQSMVVYANENNDVLPVLPPPATPGAYAVFATVAPASTADLTLNQMHQSSSMRGDVTAPFWVLALQQRTTPKQFICKSDGFVGTAAPVNDMSSNFYSNFTQGTNDRVDKTLSYSLAYPYTKESMQNGKTIAVPTIGGWWKNTFDSTMVLLSDMAPLQGTGTPATDVAGRTKLANSFNHGRDGQVVGYGDAHTMFEKSTRVGQNDDNIFTTGGGPMGTPIAPGRIDVRTFGKNETAPFDVVMVPVRDLRDGSIR